MNVRTLKPHEYGGKPRAIGDEYEMEEKFVKAMELMGHVARVEQPFVKRDQQAGPPKKYQRRDMKAD